MSLRDEIFEQPESMARLIDQQSVSVAETAARIKERGIRWTYLAARGSSDYAGLYAKYLWGAVNRMPMALAAPSLFGVYHRPPEIGDALVVGISQSGQSPDVVSVIKEGRKQGALTLAITNDPSSPLAEAAELVIDTVTGPETAVAATKTYTAQLTAIAMLSAALSGDPEQKEWLGRLPSLAEEVLASDDTIAATAECYRYMNQCVVLGRGFNYATAHEWAIKLKELAYVAAEPYSSADFKHGPVALATRGFPVFAVVPGGEVFDNVSAFLRELVGDLGVELLVVSNEKSALDLAHTAVPLPTDLPEWLSPIPSIIPAQLFCYHLTRAKGYDTEQPRGLTKVTLTW